MFLKKSFSNYVVTTVCVTIAIAVLIIYKAVNINSLIAKIYLFSFLSCGILSVFLLAKAPVVEKPIKVKKLEVLTLTLLVLGCLFVSLSEMDNHHFWLDEYTHAIMASNNPFDGSAMQQQPLLGYLWSKLLITIFGQTIEVVRMTSTIPYLCSIFILGLLGLRHKGGYFFLALFIIFHLTNGIMRYVSIDARSIGTALLFMSIAFNAWLECQETPHPVNCTFFGLSVFIFLNSVGLQPTLMIAFMLIIHVFFWILYKERIWLFLALGMVFALVAYFPIQLYISYIAHNMGYFNLSLWDRVLSKRPFPFDALYSFWLPNNDFIIGSVALVTILWIWLKHPWTLRQKKYWFLAMLFFLIFPLIFEWIFYLFINWNVMPWYRSCFIAFFIFLFSFALARFSKDWKLSFIPALCFLLLTFSPGLEMYHELMSQRDDWKMLNREIHRLYPEDNWTAYITGLCDTNTSWWCQSIFVGAEFFPPSFSFERTPGVMSREFKFFHPYLSDNAMIENFLVPYKKKRYVLAVLAKNIEIPLLPSEYGLNLKDEEDGFKAFRVNNFIVVSSTKPVEKKDGILNILKWIIRHSPQRPAFYYPYELLIHNLTLLGKKDEARMWLEELKTIPGFIEATKNNNNAPKKILSLEKIVEAIP